MKIKPIGIIHSPYKTRADAPPQGKNELAEIELFSEYGKGLKDIEGFSHLHVFYWMYKSEKQSLSVNTPWDSEPHGLFATRTPNRPNPVGYSVVELIERCGNILKIRCMDAIEGTPVIDIKPYIPGIDAKPLAKNGWLKNQSFLKKS